MAAWVSPPIVMGILYTLSRYTQLRYVLRMAIRSFTRTGIEQFFLHGKVPAKAGWASLKNVATRKLDMLDYAAVLSDLRVPPGNRLEELKGNFAGFHSIRINDQWRCIFRWEEDGPAEVDIVDYH
jgi:proteic killer suppression protein